MKTAFNLSGESINDGTLRLIAETGWYGVSFAFYKCDPLSLVGLLAYNFNDRVTATEIASNLEYIIGKEEIFRNGFSKSAVFYNFKESLLIPAKFYNEQYGSNQLDLLYGPSANSIIRSDKADIEHGIGNQESIYNIYRIPEQIHSVITRLFPGSEIMHSTSGQIQLQQNVQINCIIYHNSVKFFIFKKSRLQLVQQFHYITPEDIVYHLLNACDKHGIDPAEADLLLSGMIDVNSNLYQHIYKYFLNIRFSDIDDEVFLSEDIKEFPGHFFSHIISLTRCVS